MPEFIITILIIIVSISIYFNFQKRKIEISELENYKAQLENTQQLYEQKQKELYEIEKRCYQLNEDYKTLSAQNQTDLDAFFATQRATRQEELELEFQQRLNNKQQEFDYLIFQAEQKTQEAIALAQQTEQQIQAEVQLQQQRYASLLEPLQQYEKDQQAKLFYVIQVPDEYKLDIDYLLNSVANKIQHPDIINKLIWAEYVKPYIEATFKRVGIEDKPGIYKLTNIDSGKAYIGKSTNVKRRITDHFKSSVGITTIADQAVHHAILETGFWNWSIEIIIYCDKEQLNEMEKYYINFFKTQEFGYNKNAGGGG